jgi:hypothetical protein
VTMWSVLCACSFSSRLYDYADDTSPKIQIDYQSIGEILNL